MRYKEHIHIIRNNSNSGYSNRILYAGYTYRSITYIMDIIKTGKKIKYLNTLEKCHIYRNSKDNLPMNNVCIDAYNPIFEILYELHTR
jgi:hypothetical protein